MKIYHDIAELTREGRAFVVATVVETGGSTPQKPGSKMVVLPDGSLRGTVGGGAIEKQIIEAALRLFQSESSSALVETHLTHDLGMCCGGKMRVFLEKHGSAARLWIFGAGHVALELARLAHRIGFLVTVVDERKDWLNSERFPDVHERLVESPEDVAAKLPGGEDCYFCVVTHDHPLDQAVLEKLLIKPAAYLGVIGSRRKAERFRMRLKAAGFTDEQLRRFESPMGLSIAALTPAEIAVSIVGRLIAVRRRADLPP